MNGLNSLTLLNKEYFGERVVEIPKLFEFLQLHFNKIETILDVGCYGSKYLKELSKYAKVIDGIDIKFGEKEKEFLNAYFIGNAVDYPLGKYDLVICLSTIEHAGIEQYQVDDYLKEQFNLFKKIVDVSLKFLFVSFPYGLSSFHAGHFANIDKNRLNAFLKFLGNAKYKLSFYFNEDVHNNQGWKKIDQDVANNVSYFPEKGTRCVCILEVEK